MMCDWKTGLKMLRYAYQLKLNLLLAILFVVIGIGCLCCGEKLIVLGGTWLMLGLVYMMQPMFNLVFAGSVAASAKRKSLSLYAPDVMVVLAGVITYLVVAGIGWIKGYESADSLQLKQYMLASFVMMFLLLIYMGVAYHIFIAGSIIFAILVGFGSLLSCIMIQVFSLGLGQIYVIGFVLIVAGIVLNCVVRRLLYRRPMSKLALGAALRKRM